MLIGATNHPNSIGATNFVLILCLLVPLILKMCWYSIASMKRNLINKRLMSKSISEDGVFMHNTLSKCCVNASKFELVELLYEEIEGTIVLDGYGKKFMCEWMENILCSGMQCTNCKLASWTMKLSLTFFFDYINIYMIYMMENWYEQLRKWGIVLMAALCHLLEKILNSKIGISCTIYHLG